MTSRYDPTVSLILLVVMISFSVAAQLWLKFREPSRARRRPHTRFRSFLRSVRKALTDGPSSGELIGLSYMASLRSGRRARVWFNRTGLTTQVRLCVTTARDVVPLRVRLEGAIERLRAGLIKNEDIQTGDRAFDDRFFLESSDPRGGRRALGTDLRRRITEAFSRAGVERLVLKPGELSLEGNVGALAPSEWRTLLVHLDRVAALVETKPMRVRVLGGERDVVCDPEGKTRCAYCRDGITGEEEDLVACERCRTVLHDACWAEHGSCPMLGCEGDAPERARVGDRA